MHIIEPGELEPYKMNKISGPSNKFKNKIDEIFRVFLLLPIQLHSVTYFQCASMVRVA
jgi:hypothetical protein